MDSAERDAILMYELMKMGGKKADRALIGLVCTRNSAQIYMIKQAYYTMFNQTLENHIDGTETIVEYQTKVRTFSWELSVSLELLVRKVQNSRRALGLQESG